MSRRQRIMLIVVLLAATTAAVWNAGLRGEFEDGAVATEPRIPDTHEPVKERLVSESERASLMARAHVWRAPRVPVHLATFRNLNLEDLNCWFKVSDLGGTTPKFDCVLETGEQIRIKYGSGPEIPAETAASRLLDALGFGADRITLVKTLRCHGCPEEPFSMMKTVELTRAAPLFERVVDYDEIEEFHWVVLEHKFDAPAIETDGIEGWPLFELDTVDEHAGGAPRTHVDALRLMAVLLAHWDNKSENQRLVCIQETWEDGTPCTRPFLLLQDVGATFGPVKMDLEAWENAPIWEDRAQCTVSMRHLPYEGATFGRAVISEAGRTFLGDLLSRLSEDQLHDLFSEARFDAKRNIFAAAHETARWVVAFQSKVRAITDGPPCPVP